MQKFDIIYHCDASVDIGMGHVFRGIDIVNAYIGRYPNSTIALRGNYQESIISFIRQQLHSQIHILPFDNISNAYISIVDTMFYPGETNVNPKYFIKVKKTCQSLVFLWDSLEYFVPEEVDIVINHLPYVQLMGESKYRKYTGFKYTPVLSSFYKEFPYKLKNGHILSVLGSTNEPYSIHPYLKELDSLDTTLEKVVLVSPIFSKEVKKDLQEKFKHIQFKQYVPKIIDLIKEASVVVTTYGNTTFQVMAAKIPVFTIAYQDFQNNYGIKLEESGYATNLGKFEAISHEKLVLLLDENFKKNRHNKLNKTFRSSGMDEILKILSDELQRIK